MKPTDTKIIGGLVGLLFSLVFWATLIGGAWAFQPGPLAFCSSVVFSLGLILTSARLLHFLTSAGLGARRISASSIWCGSQPGPFRRVGSNLGLSGPQGRRVRVSPVGARSVLRDMSKF